MQCHTRVCLTWNKRITRTRSTRSVPFPFLLFSSPPLSPLSPCFLFFRASYQAVSLANQQEKNLSADTQTYSSSLFSRDATTRSVHTKYFYLLRTYFYLRRLCIIPKYIYKFSLFYHRRNVPLPPFNVSVIVL